MTTNLLSILSLGIIVIIVTQCSGLRTRYSGSSLRSYSSYRSYIPSTYRSYRSYSYRRYYNYYYYSYYSMYYTYRSGYYSNRYSGGSGVNTCKNYELNENGTSIGVFTCPLPFEPENFRYCCGETNAEYCCRYIDAPGIKTSVVFGILVSLGVAGGAVFLVYYMCYRRPHNKRMVVPLNGQRGRPPPPPPGYGRRPPPRRGNQTQPIAMTNMSGNGPQPNAWDPQRPGYQQRGPNCAPQHTSYPPNVAYPPGAYPTQAPASNHVGPPSYESATAPPPSYDSAPHHDKKYDFNS